MAFSWEVAVARQPRPDLPGVPQHIMQRGNDRNACFAAPIACGQYPQELREAAIKYGCAVHACVPMANHVHLFVISAEAGAISRMMHAAGTRYVAS